MEQVDNRMQKFFRDTYYSGFEQVKKEKLHYNSDQHNKLSVSSCVGFDMP